MEVVDVLRQHIERDLQIARPAIVAAVADRQACAALACTWYHSPTGAFELLLPFTRNVCHANSLDTLTH